MSRIKRLIILTLAAACVCSSAWAASPKKEGPDNSNLDGELFYQLLVGELTAQTGDSGSAYAIMLDAARKANSPRLYERAVEIALRARNGESALEAAQAWARAFPSSREANRYQLQILLGLNRIPETQEPLKRELAGLSAAERVTAINQLPRYFHRTSDKKLAASVVEKILGTELASKSTGPVAWAAIANMRLQADDMDGALEAVRRGVALDPMAEEPVLLAIALIGPKAPTAEAIVRKYLDARPTPEVRMTFARNLINRQRYADAYVQMQALTAEKPALAEAWLMRGSLELQDAKLALAETSIKTYVDLSPPAPDASPTAPMGRGLVQAYLMLAQVAEQGQRWDEAQSFLDQINSPPDTLRVQRRRAQILARQGKLDEARAAIRNVPELQEADALDKINAEVQLLRDHRQYASAYAILQEAVTHYPQDVDLMYDLAMMAERLGKADEMEQLLRQVMQAKPDYHHAYNALGYSLAERNIRLPEARELVTRALVLAPEDPFILDSLAWVEFRSGNSAEALRLLQNAFRARPDAEIAAHLGEVLWATGQRDQAGAIWQEGVGLNPQNETLLETMRRLRGNP